MTVDAVLASRYAAGLVGVSQWATEVDWSNDGGHTWQSSTFRQGSVTCSSVSQVRWVATVNLQDVPFGLGGLNPYQTRFRIRHGLRYSAHEKVRWQGMGVYCLTSISRSTTDRSEYVLEGSSYEVYLMRAAFTKPVTYRQASAVDLLTRLIRDVLPDALIDWNSSVEGGQIITKLIIERDRWGTIDGGKDATSLAKSMAARVYPDEAGIWRVEPVATLQDTPVWEAKLGPGGVLLRQDEQLSNENVENVQVVYGSPSGDNLVGPGIARDDNPTSPTFVGTGPDLGGFGEAPAETYTSQLILTRGQAQAVAEARLATRLGLKQQLTFDMLHDPTKRPGQVGVIHGFGVQRAILDSVTYDLSSTPGALQCTTRTTATRLTGGQSEVTE